MAVPFHPFIKGCDFLSSSESTMASTATFLHISSDFQLQCSLNENPCFVGNPRSVTNNLILQRHPFSSSSFLTFARRRGHKSTDPPIQTKKLSKKQNSSKKGVEGDEDDAFEALFRQLEEDLKNDDLSVEDDDDITEEDLVMLERELEEALKDDELLGTLGLLGDAKTEDEPEEEEEEGENGNDDYTANHDDQDLEEEDEEEEMPVKLKNWQLKRLAYALKSGRRRTSIKNLAADLCLDRAVVLELLRDPPPNLLMLSATLPEKPVSKILEPVNELTETVPLEMTSVALKPEAEVKLPVHVMQSNWSAKKRIKKAQLDTLELVYRRSKRPTNAMISSIVHLTNLPRKKVLKWFEDKRAEEGVPAHRLPYQRSDSVFT